MSAGENSRFMRSRSSFGVKVLVCSSYGDGRCEAQKAVGKTVNHLLAAFLREWSPEQLPSSTAGGFKGIASSQKALNLP